MNRHKFFVKCIVHMHISVSSKPTGFLYRNLWSYGEQQFGQRRQVHLSEEASQCISKNINYLPITEDSIFTRLFHLPDTAEQCKLNNKVLPPYVKSLVTGLHIAQNPMASFLISAIVYSHILATTHKYLLISYSNLDIL